MVHTSLTQGRSKTFILRASVLLFLVIAVSLFAHFRSGRAAANVEESIIRVEKRNFTQSLRLNGTTLASRSFIVLAPCLEDAQISSMYTLSLHAALPIARASHGQDD